jgi:hypothetical protein
MAIRAQIQALRVNSWNPRATNESEFAAKSKP